MKTVGQWRSFAEYGVLLQPSELDDKVRVDEAVHIAQDSRQKKPVAVARPRNQAPLESELTTIVTGQVFVFPLVSR